MDIKYWSQFYKTKTINLPSDFCLFIMTYFEKQDLLNILDAGCGNGRDSYHMSKSHNVIGIDSSSKPDDLDNCKFYKDDFCTYNKDDFNLIYSRFTFHSITNEDHKIFLESITKKNTYLCIETRSDKSEKDFRYHGDMHYRNYTNLKYVKDLLKLYNFEILYIKEDNNFAIYKNENPICIRIICKKL
jgi:tellurite methyltransferase